MRDLVNRFLEVSIAEVRRYDGTVPQFAGDGFMAVFGAPLTHEDHVRRALLAALGIRRALGDEGGTADRGLDLPVRIGIHTGPVVFGPIGGNLGLDTAIGDAANLTARLQQAAEPGAILVSETTWLSAQRYSRVDPVGPLTLKGKAEPIPAYLLLGVSRWRAASDGVMPERTTSFVDRINEVAALESFVDQAENGHGRAVGIVGEPGIGKSRILDQGRLPPWPLSQGRRAMSFLRHRDPVPAGPRSVAQQLRHHRNRYARRNYRESLRRSARGRDESRPGQPISSSRIGDHRMSPTLPVLLRPEAVKQKTFEIFRQLAVKGSQRRPLILVLIDLHWVDTLSAELAGFLAEHRLTPAS